jgi:protein-S-isoprenylcysteine O-methyltransferase Ste14
MMGGMSEPDNAGVVAPPPAIYGAALALGLALQYLWPLRVHGAPGIRLVGLLLAGVGLALGVAAFREFQRQGTSIDPRQPTTTLIRTGLFRFSRNPVYVGVTALYLGIALAVNSLWLVLLLVPTLAVMSRGVIDREERYLERKFGEAYRDYRRSVRRWI